MDPITYVSREPNKDCAIAFAECAIEIAPSNKNDLNAVYGYCVNIIAKNIVKAEKERVARGGSPDRELQQILGPLIECLENAVRKAGNTHRFSVQRQISIDNSWSLQPGFGIGDDLT
ncbi:MAG: hypothetical protein M1829_002818 [Trizodia sp. TS-e1964]|nr:MAG: hypothetical protein M1829_002818 [Trizodia sp. TS-e1964]